MIVAFTSNRDWFATYLTQNYCSDVFIFFHEEFNFVDKFDLKQELKNSVITLDNLKVHRSKATIKFMSNDIYCFLLSLRIHKKAPIELFLIF